MKKMKLALTGLFALVLISACGGCKKTSPEDEVRNYSKYFIDKVTANQLDSIKASYPDILVADSIVPLQSDSIIVSETQTPGLYEVTLAEGVTLKVNRSEDGNITVEESIGLFAYPSDKVEVAKKSGMWDNQLNDVQLAERMKDEEFFKWLKEAKTIKTSDIIALGKIEGDGYYTEGFRYVDNKTDQPIKGSDYQVIRAYDYILFNGVDGYDENSGTEVLPGKDIAPGGSVKFEFSCSSHGGEEIKSVKLTLTPEEIQERFATYTGNEYQDYLDSKK